MTSLDDRRTVRTGTESAGERAVLISGSPSASSRSRALLERAGVRLEAAGFAATVIDLAALPADALLGRRPDPAVAAALAAGQSARIVVASSPVYRATYTGLLKAFFDLFPADALRGAIGLPILTGGSPAHSLAVDHGLRPLFASLGAVTVATGVYGYDGQFTTAPGIAPMAAEPGVAAGRRRNPGAGTDGVDPELLARLDRAVEEAIALARAAEAA